MTFIFFPASKTIQRDGIVLDEKYLLFYERKNPYRRVKTDLPGVLDIFPLPLQIYFLPFPTLIPLPEI